MPNELKVELKNIKHSEFGSQETYDFEAVIHLDGRRAINVSNEGHGGSHLYREIIKGACERLKAHCKTLPSIQAYGTTLPMSPDICINELVTEFLTRRDYLRAKKKKILFTLKNKPGVFEIKIPHTPETAKKLREKKPDTDQILNELPDAEAIKFWKNP